MTAQSANGVEVLETQTLLANTKRRSVKNAVVYGTGAGLRQNNKYDIVPTFRQRTGPDYHFYSLEKNHTYFLNLEMLRISALTNACPWVVKEPTMQQHKEDTDVDIM